MRDHQYPLLDLYRDQYSSLIELDQLLSEEYILLKKGAVGQLAKYTENKRRSLDKIMGLDDQRRAQQDPFVVRSTEKQPDKQKKLKIIKEKMDVLMEKCRRQNQINGSIITANKNFYSKVLEIICNGGIGETVYGASGKNKDAHLSQSLAKI